jgi:hypothetical protein
MSNCLSYWFPKIERAGLPVPKTEIVRTDVDLLLYCHGEERDGPKPVEAAQNFLSELSSAAKRISESGPWFLRTGQGSGKHGWKNTCYLKDLADLPRHVAALVEWSHMVDFLGLPTDVWVVREMLPTRPVAILPAYGDMPLVREVRVFVRDSEVVCWHPYWPSGSIREGFVGRKVPENFPELCGAVSKFCDQHQVEICDLARRAGEAIGGAWSVDVLETVDFDRRFFVTDMAEAERSWHWDGCLHAKEFR